MSQRRLGPALTTFGPCRRERQTGMRAVADGAAAREARAAAGTAVSGSPRTKRRPTLGEIRRHAVAVPNRRAEAAATQTLPGVPPNGDSGRNRTVTHSRSRSGRRTRGRLRRRWEFGLGGLHTLLEFLHLADQATDLTKRARLGQSPTATISSTTTIQAASAVVECVVEPRDARAGRCRESGGGAIAVAVGHRRGTRMGQSLRAPGSMQGPRRQGVPCSLLARETRVSINGLAHTG